MKSRFILILIVLVSLWCLLALRAAQLQFTPDTRLAHLKKRQFETVVNLSARRGDILDRNGREFAVSMTAHSLFVDPPLLESPKKLAKVLSKILPHELNISIRELEAKLHKRDTHFIWLARHLDRAVRDRIEALKVKGLGFVEESKRIYPNDRSLSQVIGFVGREGRGLEGVELKYNDQLEATKKQLSMRRDARGRPLIVNGQLFRYVPDGNDISLTIDRDLQFQLEQELANTVHENEADSAVGVVLDAKTSEVLAMSSYPSFDPNEAMSAKSDRVRNKSVTDAFEPGSVMKTFLISSAIAKKKIEPNSHIDCGGGELKIGKRTIHEADKHHRFKELSVSDILSYSSNVGTSRIGLDLGAKGVRESMESFGFGIKTGLDLPGESKGIVQKLPWSDHLTANVSIGHGITATPLQIANAYAVIANGGWLMRPTILKKILDRESGEVSEGKPTKLRRVIEEDVAAKMRLMLTQVTSRGATGFNARVAGFPVAGKTGTAQKVAADGKGYMSDGYISSFAGFLPSNDPRFVIYIGVDRPRKKHFGSEVAAPVFARVAQYAVRKSGLQPVFVEEADMVRVSKSEATQPPAAAEVVTLPASSSDISATEKSNLTQPLVTRLFSVISPGLFTRLFFGEPPGSSLIPKPGPGTAVAGLVSSSGLRTHAAFGSGASSVIEPAIAKPLAHKPVISEMPNLEGLTLREVYQQFRQQPFPVSVRGNGNVVETQPSAGAKLSPNGRVTVILGQNIID
jgi:cell division protein FtsI (penicillin-binding protein 3)